MPVVESHVSTDGNRMKVDPEITFGRGVQAFGGGHLGKFDEEWADFNLTNEQFNCGHDPRPPWSAPATNMFFADDMFYAVRCDVS